MQVQRAYATIDTGTDDGGTGGTGGGIVTLDYPAPMDPAGLVVPPNPNGYNPPPPQPIYQYGTGYPVPGGQVSEPPRTVDTVPNLVTLNATGPVLSPANPPVGGLPVAPPAAAGMSPWLLVAAAMAATYVVMKSGPQRAGSAETKRVLLPVLVVGGLGALYVLNKKDAVVLPSPVQSVLPVEGGGHGTILVP